MFYISISNGLLERGHRKKMGASVWEFMWLIDKITKVEEGVGEVLGGKPINLSDIGKGFTKTDGERVPGLGSHDNTISRNLQKLEKHGYIGLNHTPHGIVINVFKAKKRFTKNVESFTKNVESFTKNGERNIRHINDNTKTIIPLRSEAQNFNQELFNSFKAITGENPKDEPSARMRYPRLIRKKWPEITFVRSALQWGWDLHSKQGTFYYRNGNLTLAKLYFRICPDYQREVNSKNQLTKLSEMRRNTLKSIPA